MNYDQQTRMTANNEPSCSSSANNMNDNGICTSCSLLDRYIIICPTGIEAFTCHGIRRELKQFTCNLQLLRRPIENEHLDQLKATIQKQQAKKINKKRKTWHPIFHDSSKIFGTTKCPLSDREISIGFHEDDTIISHPGGLEGKTLIQIDTNAPPITMARIRSLGCGPLLALVHTSFGSNEDIVNTTQQVQEATSNFKSYFDLIRKEYDACFCDAMKLWQSHVKKVWTESSDVKKFLDNRKVKKRTINDTIKKVEINLNLDDDDLVKYRCSLLRSHSKDFKYKRDEIIAQLCGFSIPNLNNNSGKKLVVDLDNFDMEVVVFLHDGLITVAISLDYYQYIGAKSFCSGTIAPDIQAPYITGEISQTITRLRPSIASIMVDMSGCTVGDIIIDPCAGVQTIPVEASFKKAFAIGGDLALANQEGLYNVVHSYCKHASEVQRRQQLVGASDMMAWDATLTPIRDGTIDCIISDLPFGKQCLSANELNNFLPLFLNECARILKKGGKALFLCGAVHGMLDALLTSSVGSDLFDKPTSILPVNIGGISAWIFYLRRSDAIYEVIPQKWSIMKRISQKRVQKQVSNGRIQF